MGLISNLITHARDIRPPTRFRAATPYLFRLALLACAYALTAWLSLSFALRPDIVTPFWPPAAIALYGCLAWGLRMAPSIWIGSLLGTLSAAMPLGSAVVIATGCTVEACVGALLVQRLYHTRSDFIYQGAIFRFVGIALVISMISATSGALGLVLAFHPDMQTLAIGWLTWWLGDASGIIVGVPLIMAWRIGAGVQWDAGKIAEALAFALLLPTVTQITFGGVLGNWPLAYMTIPFFLWAALRFNLSAVTWTTATICVISVWNTAHGNGPFASSNLNISLLLLMIYVSVVGSMGLVLANQAYQRSRVETQLREERDGREQHVLRRTDALVSDIEQRKHTEASLREAEERYRKVVELSPDAILVQQDSVFVYANPAAVQLLNANSMADIAGKSLFDFLHPDFHEVARERIACLRQGEALAAIEERFIRLNGDEVDVEVNSSPFLHRGTFATLFIMRDITERKKTIEQMAYLAHYDSLTGLPNRTLFHQRLAHALTIATRPGRSLEILFLDLDRFKNINDTLGHATGDIVLKETAARLQGILRESDTVARLGGDEFVVLVENVDEPHRGGIIAEKILAAFVPPFLRDKEPLSISSSIGIASFPSDGTDADTLLKKADNAMYRAKEAGRNNYRYFSPEMNLHTAERLSLEYALGHAIERDELSLHYQPKIDVATNRISGMEALLRWRHPTMGLVPPNQFIPVAEESGLIKPIGYWAIRTACTQNKTWQQVSPARLKVAVNLSSRQLSDGKLVENIDAILSDTGLDPGYLELEITENAIMADPEKAIAVLDTLRERGISVAIDDFGIGYSSLAYLKRFPIRAVKIDRSFVQGLPFSRGDSAITKAIISFAHSLECSVIAEGAETQQQYDFLRENDCDSVQGFYFSEPMPAENFGDLIKVQANLHLH